MLVDILEVDSAWSGVAIDPGMRHVVGVGSTESTDEVVECALGLEDRQVDHTHMVVECHTDLVDAAHACSRESSSALESRLECCFAREPWIPGTCLSPV